MASLNKIMLIGRLGGEVEIKYSESGTAVANFSIATEESWKDKKGEKQKKTTWFKIVCWKRLAEVAGEYLSKGREVYIEGKIDNRTWEDKEGVKHYVTEVIASSLQMLGGKGDGGVKKSQSEDPGPVDDSDIPF
jgi:single-strand DNA-binding protein